MPPSAFDTAVASLNTTAPAAGTAPATASPAPKAAPAATAAPAGGSAFDTALSSLGAPSSNPTTANTNPAPSQNIFQKTLGVIGGLSSATKSLFTTAPPVTSTTVPKNNAAQLETASGNKDLNTTIDTKANNTAEKLFPSTYQTVKDLGADPLSLKANPKNVLTDVWNNLKTTAQGGTQNIRDIFSAPTAAGKVNAGLESVKSLAGDVLSPITTLFTAANDIPVLSSLTKIISLPFNVTGDAGKDVGIAAVKSLPIPAAAKATLMKGIPDIFSLAAQIVAGGAIYEGTKEMLVKKYGPTDAATIEQKATEMAAADKAHTDAQGAKALDVNKMTTSDHPDAIATTVTMQHETNALLKTMSPEEVKAHLESKLGVTDPVATQLIENAKPQGNAIDSVIPKAEETQKVYRAGDKGNYYSTSKDYVQQGGFKGDIREADIPKNLNTISVDEVNKLATPEEKAELKTSTTIQSNRIYKDILQRNGYDGMKIDEEGSDGKPYQSLLLTDKNSPDFKETGPTATEPVQNEPKVEPSTNVNDKTPSTVGKSIEAKAIEAKLTTGFDGVAGYDKLTFKDQAEKAANLINGNLDQARAIVRGEAPLPEGLRGTALIAGMEDYIKKNPDGDLAHELANSPLVSGNSAAAQELGLSRMREQDSATAKLQEIKQAKMKNIDEKTVTNVRKSIQSEVGKVTLPKEDLSWDNFLEKITC